jgi:hypothetical protein
MSIALSILERIYVQPEAVFGTAPNTSGTATVAGSNYVRHTKSTLQATQALIPSTDKTGSISATQGAIGARGGTWSLDFEARPNGAAGVVPDCDPILQAAFGQAATIVASTSATYTLANAIKSFTMYRFRQPSTIQQRAGIGCVVGDMSFAFAQNANAKFTLNGTCLWVPDSKNFPSLDTVGKGGLTTFPAEPGSPVFNGTPVNGLAGSATIDGGSTMQIRSAAIKFTSAIVIPQDRLFAGQYGSSPERDILSVTLDLSIFDEDTAAVTSLYNKALAGTTINIVLVAGSVAGSMIEFGLNDCLLPQPQHDDSARKWAANLTGIRAYATTLTSLDEFYLKFK